MTQEQDIVERLNASAQDFDRPPSIQSQPNIRAINNMHEAAKTIADLRAELDDYKRNARDAALETQRICGLWDAAIRERDELQKRFDHANTMENFWCDKSKELAGRNDALRVERDEARKALEDTDETCARIASHCMVTFAGINSYADELKQIALARRDISAHIRARSASSNREGGA